MPSLPRTRPASTPCTRAAYTLEAREKMLGKKFSRYQLRTTDVDGARAFYTNVLGPELWGTDVTLSPLPESARARGAPAHWLGHVGVPNIEETAARLTALGAERLGPAQQTSDGFPYAVLRDPFGVILALGPERKTPRPSPVVWHVMHTEDHVPTFAAYAALFGWTPTEALDLGPELGSHQLFAWNESAESVGSIANTARLPHIHRQWLFFFGVADLDESMARVRELGGLALEPVRMSTGDRVVPCDDPQGAAFGLYQFAGASRFASATSRPTTSSSELR